MKTDNWNPATYDAPRRRLVPCYDDFYGTVAELVGRLAVRRPRVLDLGAGTGLLAAELTKRVEVGDLTLMDASAAMLERAAVRLADRAPRIVVGNFGEMLPAGPFDAVVSALAIHHLDDAGKRDLFRRVHACLAPGGLFVNAEQVSSADPVQQQVFEATHLEYAKKLGSGRAEIEAAVQRMEADRCASAEAQVGWLAEAGFARASVYYQWFRFAVYAGCKLKTSSS